MIALLAAALERADGSATSDAFGVQLGRWIPWLHTVDGPTFLLIYLMFFVVVRSILAAVRTQTDYALGATALTLLAFEGVGCLRWLVGSAYGMHRWQGLLIMMILGGAIILLHNDGTRSSDSGSNCSSGCGGGSSSGSGCGGGGGCGGCGGGD